MVGIWRRFWAGRSRNEVYVGFIVAFLARCAIAWHASYSPLSSTIPTGNFPLALRISLPRRSLLKSPGVLLLTLFSLCSFAQETKNELGLLLGAEFVPQRTIASGIPVDFDNSIVFSANYARHLTGENTAFFLEFPSRPRPSTQSALPIQTSSARLQPCTSRGDQFVAGILLFKDLTEADAQNRGSSIPDSNRLPLSSTLAPISDQ
jgi:hypothetical protein